MFCKRLYPGLRVQTTKFGYLMKKKIIVFTIIFNIVCHGKSLVVPKGFSYREIRAYVTPGTRPTV